MALPILDGNQSATTLSTIITGGAHIPAHTVVSLGTQARSDITSAISGSVVSISNFPSTQTIAGTVTANNSTIDGFFSSALEESGTDGASWAVRVQGSVSNPLPISGTVTANVSVLNNVVENFDEAIDQNVLAVHIKDFSGNVLGSSGSPLPISGTVTANVPSVTVATNGNFPQSSPIQTAIGVFNTNNPNQILGVFGAEETEGEGISAFVSVRNPISGTVTVGNSVTIGSLPAISGTVTANSIFPRVTFIDGSGTVATANTAITVFASSSTRSYLLVQVTTGSAFVNVGATATTVNGINLTAGQGYAWETTIPQGIVSLISTTTSSRYVAKEA